MRFRPEQYDAILFRLVNGGKGEDQPGNPNMLVPWYLMASYAYYELDDPFFTDGTYDWLCKELDARWNEVEHRHKMRIDRGALAAGTGFQLAGTLPLTIEHATKALLRDYNDPDEIRPGAGSSKVDIDDLLGISPPASLDDLFGGAAAPTLDDLL